MCRYGLGAVFVGFVGSQSHKFAPDELGSPPVVTLADAVPCFANNVHAIATLGNDRVEPQIVDAGQYRWDNPIFLLSACTAPESIMKKVLLLISVTVAALIVTITTTLFAVIYVRDSRTIEKAKEVVLRVDQFCLERGRLPEKDEFDALFPGLTASADWFYWPTPDRAEVRIQYPMSSHHRGAPGTSKTSEFTATTYAYIMSVKC